VDCFTLRNGAAAPDTPVFVLHLYDRAFLSGAALGAVGSTEDTPASPGSEIQRDRHGNPRGLLIARPNAMILYWTLAKGPKLSYEDQLNSTRLLMRKCHWHQGRRPDDHPGLSSCRF
jgi:predicted amidohydrolase YtcJ